MFQRAKPELEFAALISPTGTTPWPSAGDLQKDAILLYYSYYYRRVGLLLRDLDLSPWAKFPAKYLSKDQTTSLNLVVDPAFRLVLELAQTKDRKRLMQFAFLSAFVEHCIYSEELRSKIMIDIFLRGPNKFEFEIDNDSILSKRLHQVLALSRRC